MKILLEHGSNVDLQDAVLIFLFLLMVERVCVGCVICFEFFLTSFC